MKGTMFYIYLLGFLVLSILLWFGTKSANEATAAEGQAWKEINQTNEATVKKQLEVIHNLQAIVKQMEEVQRTNEETIKKQKESLAIALYDQDTAWPGLIAIYFRTGVCYGRSATIDELQHSQSLVLTPEIPGEADILTESIARFVPSIQKRDPSDLSKHIVTELRK